MYIPNNDSEGNHYTKFRHVGYNRKTLLKSQIVLEALNLGLSVFHIDADTVLLKNPQAYLHHYQNYDIATILEFNGTDYVHNTGVFLANPTSGALSILTDLQNIQKRTLKSNQVIFNELVSTRQGLKLGNLKAKQFHDGYTFFIQHKLCCSFAFDSCCPRNTSVLLHNNMAFLLSAKIYRFKEHLMWTLDQNGY